MLQTLKRSALAALVLTGMAAAAQAECPTCDQSRVGKYYGTYDSHRNPANGADAVAYPPGRLPPRERAYPQPDLFYNYYYSGPNGGQPAQLYMSPRPVPPNVGHTYITYQPLMPHEFMYKHYRTYHQYYDGGRGLTRTKVIYW